MICIGDNYRYIETTTEIISVTEISMWRKIAVKRCAIYQKRSGGMLSSRLKKYQYAMSAYIVAL